jgi:hypothetical protein
VQGQAVPRQDHPLDPAVPAPALVVPLDVDVAHVRDRLVRRVLRPVHDEVVLARLAAALREREAAGRAVNVNQPRVKAERH